MGGTVTQTLLSADVRVKDRKLRFSISNVLYEATAETEYEMPAVERYIDLIMDEVEKEIAKVLFEAEAGERERIKQIMQKKYCGELMEEDVDPPQKEMK